MLQVRLRGEDLTIKKEQRDFNDPDEGAIDGFEDEDHQKRGVGQVFYLKIPDVSAEETFVEQGQKDGDVDDRPGGCQHEGVVGYCPRWAEAVLSVQPERGEKDNEWDADGSGDVDVP